MGLSIVRYQTDNESNIHWGILNKDNKISQIPEQFEQLSQLIAKFPEAVGTWKAIGPTLSFDEVKILSPVTKPCKLICQGLNYADHREEAGKERSSDYNLLFRKDEGAITGAYDQVQIPAACKIFDYEIELGLVVKQNVHTPVKVTEENIPDYIAAWFIANDFSARDMMFRASFRQWYLGKSARSLCPIGPILFFPDKDDWKHFDNLELTLTVDGEIRQQAFASQLIFRPAETISYLSQNLDLYAGDCILTGTPGGVALAPPSKIKRKIAELLFDEKKQVEMMVKMNKDNPRILRPNQKVCCTIKTKDGSIDLGEMENMIIK